MLPESFILFKPRDIVSGDFYWFAEVKSQQMEGRDKDYEHDGISHHAHDVKGFLDQFENIKQYWPMAKGAVPKMLRGMLADEGPSFISLMRS
jgi:hypothetical protein